MALKIKFCLLRISRWMLPLTFLFFQKEALAALPIYFDALTVEDGLSNSSVLSILQDSQGFIWLGTRDGLNRYDGTRVKVYRDFFSGNPLGVNVKVNAIVEDKNRNLWIGTSKGLYLYNERNGTFPLKILGTINTIFKDADSNLWVGSTNGLYFLSRPDAVSPKFTFIKYDGIDARYFNNVQAFAQKRNGQLVLGTSNGIFTLKKNGASFFVTRPQAMNGVNVLAMGTDTFQNIWMGSNKTGLYKADPALTRIRHYLSGGSNRNILDNNVRKIYSDRKGNLWIGSLKGLNRYDPASDQFESWIHDASDPGSLNNNSIYDIYEDRQGSLWVGTYYGGVNIKEARTTQFKVYKNEPGKNSLSSNIVSAIAETLDGNYWIGTEAEGLNLVDLHRGRVERFNTANNRLHHSNLVKTIFQDHANQLWIGLYGGGINFTNTPKGQFYSLTTENSRLNSNDITSIVEDEKQRLWVGQQENGINIITKNRTGILRFNEVFPAANLIDSGITFLYRSSGDDIYIGTRSGVFLCPFDADDNRRKIRKIFPTTGKSTYINCIVEDSAHQIWIGSGSGIGLGLYDEKTGSLSLHTLKDGLPSNRVVGIVPDGAGNLWLSTHNGISKFNLKRKRFTNYDKFDGLPSKVFNYNSFYKDRNGHIFFGSLDGLVSFLPSEIEVNPYPPMIGLEALSVNGKWVKVGDSSGILKAPLARTRALRLAHHQSDLIINYSVFNFIKPHKNRSAYKLEGYNADWVSTDDHQAVFTRLQPGTYTLFLKASNNDGVWSEPLKSLKITVMPPLWKTWWAYCLYVLTFLLGLRFFVKFYNSRQALKRELQYEHQLNLQQQELQKMKTDFFTYMSHELRTPLTLISGPAEVLIDQATEGTMEKKLAQSIKSSSDRMLTLTNNLMDLMKADSGSLKLHFVVSDIVSFAATVFEKFRIQANEKKIDFQFNSTRNEIKVNFDRHYMEIVFTNLLANAIKYTAEAGSIMMFINVIDEQLVAISVCDNGTGISEQDAGKLFTDFFQAVPEIQKQQGTGVGLALCKKLVELHKGSIKFSSDIEVNATKMTTCFTVYLDHHCAFSKI